MGHQPTQSHYEKDPTDSSKEDEIGEGLIATPTHGVQVLAFINLKAGDELYVVLAVFLSSHTYPRGGVGRGAVPRNSWNSK